ncbi:hypothetical protein C8T65DRAFT_744245 [Cerioporus squamosus]|nr:hypothetical protein C8T65DRAFT_744245 [Cerioporus squamosus]
MARATQLRQLYIPHIDVLLCSAPELGAVIGRMERLEVLEVDAQRPSDAVSALLSTLRAPLSRFSLHFNYSQPRDRLEESPTPTLILIALLQRTSQTLVHISLENVTISGWADIVLPKLEHLEATAVELPSTDVLAHALPNLATLVIRDVYWDPKEPVDVRTAVSRRDDNHSRQERHGSWPHLKSITGPVVEVFSLGAICSVPHLILKPDQRSDTDLVMLRALLEFTPGLARLELSTREDIFDLGWPFDEEAMWDLRELEERSDVWEQAVLHTQMELSQTFNSYHALFQTSARRLRLEELVFRVHVPCFVHDCTPGREVAEVVEPGTQPHPEGHSRGCPTAEALKDYDTLGSLEAFFTRAPSLRKGELLVMHHDDPVAHYICQSVEVHARGSVYSAGGIRLVPSRARPMRMLTSRGAFPASPEGKPCDDHDGVHDFSVFPCCFFFRFFIPYWDFDMRIASCTLYLTFLHHALSSSLVHH